MCGTVTHIKQNYRNQQEVTSITAKPVERVHTVLCDFEYGVYLKAFILGYTIKS